MYKARRWQLCLGVLNRVPPVSRIQGRPAVLRYKLYVTTIVRAALPSFKSLNRFHERGQC